MFLYNLPEIHKPKIVFGTAINTIGGIVDADTCSLAAFGSATNGVCRYAPSMRVAAS